jgi:hypothetical protein
MIFLGNFITFLMLINLGMGFLVETENEKITKISE